jgi:hypothetical protein
LRIIELGERLGFDSAWLRHRHLQFEISSPIAMMSAATQRTSRTELGTVVTPLGWENHRGSAGRGRINTRLGYYGIWFKAGAAAVSVIGAAPLLLRVHRTAKTAA